MEDLVASFAESSRRNLDADCLGAIIGNKYFDDIALKPATPKMWIRQRRNSLVECIP